MRRTLPLIAAAALLLFVAAVLVIDRTRAGVVADGVKIGSVAVGGLDREQAIARVRDELADSVVAPVEATYRTRSFTLEPDDAKARLDAAASVDAALRRGRGANPFSRVLAGGDASGTVTPRIAYSRAAVDEFVARVAEDVDRDARDADIAWRDGKLDRTPARDGVRTQRGELRAAIVGLLGDPDADRRLEVPVEVVERPDRTMADLAERYPTVIAIDRDARRLRLYKDLELAHKYRIAVGKAGKETTAGRYEIESKAVNPTWYVPDSDWAGELAGKQIPPGDPRNPIEARWMGFHDGQGIHGTENLSSLGGAASHGCIRMAVPDVKELYGLVPKGTPVFVQ